MELSFVEAMRLSLREEMLADSRVFILGTDVGESGGLFKITQGLLAEFGESRIMDAPISESAIVGAGVGAAMMGLRPVIDLHYADFLTIAMDQIVNNAATARYLSNGQLSVPLVILATYGFGASAHHSHSPEAWFLNIPGLKIVMPSTPSDARGLLKSSIRDGNPIIFLEHRKLLATRGSVNEDDPSPIPIGIADVKRPGKDLTLVSRGLMSHRSLAAAATVSSEDGIDVEVIDMRTIRPIDYSTILKSVTKTTRIMVVEESPKMGGVGGDIIAVVAEECLGFLDSPPRRVTAPDTPVPVNDILLENYAPSEGGIVNGIREMFGIR